jgi:arylsulfatase A-like enzyme
MTQKLSDWTARNPTRRSVVGGCGALFATLGATKLAGATEPASPNILFILADDLGYADLSCYGRPDYRTPVLDKLAAQGVMLTQGYANSAVCSATRVALITGRYQYRLPVGLEEPIPTRDDGLGLPPGQPTLPSLLRARGYRTALVGKWHMGSPPAYGPLKSGYDRFFGIVMGAADYFTHRAADRNHPNQPGLYEGDRPVERDGYLTDLFADRAIEEIRSASVARRPFFLSLHFNAPHWPWEGPNDRAVAATVADLHNYDGGSLATYGEMVRAMDAGIGRVLAALDALGQTENTIVVFTSDNGGERYSDNWPFTGGKTELLEGGLRVPLIVRWPGAIASGAQSDQVMTSMDWLPTLLAAGGGAPSPRFPPDGEDLLDVLTGREKPRPRKLYWRFKNSEQAAVRDGDWKYLKLGGYEYLFDVATDPRERANLKLREPTVFDRLRRDYAAWNATMLPYPASSFSGGSKGELADHY